MTPYAQEACSFDLRQPWVGGADNGWSMYGHLSGTYDRRLTAHTSGPPGLNSVSTPFTTATDSFSTSFMNPTLPMTGAPSATYANTNASIPQQLNEHQPRIDSRNLEGGANDEASHDRGTAARGLEISRKGTLLRVASKRFFSWNRGHACTYV